MQYVYDVNLVNKIVCELGIDNNQFHLLCLLSEKPRGESSADIELYKDKYQTHHPDNNRYLITMLKDLEEKGLIEDLNHKDEQYMYYNADFLHVTPKFLEYIYVDPEQAALDLWESYPKWLMIDGKKMSSRSNTSLEEVENLYSKVIRRDKRLHGHVLQLMKENYQEGYAEMGLEKFINSRHWELLEENSKTHRHGVDI
jgi:hypothetical protein